MKWWQGEWFFLSLSLMPSPFSLPIFRIIFSLFFCWIFFSLLIAILPFSNLEQNNDSHTVANTRIYYKKYYFMCIKHTKCTKRKRYIFKAGWLDVCVCVYAKNGKGVSRTFRFLFCVIVVVTGAPCFLFFHSVDTFSCAQRRRRWFISFLSSFTTFHSFAFVVHNSTQ